jgi:hypothetical protein
MELVLYVGAALGVGLWVGGSFARLKRSRTDVRGARGLLVGARKKRAAAAMHSVRAGILLFIVVLVFILGLRAAGKL